MAGADKFRVWEAAGGGLPCSPHLGWRLSAGTCGSNKLKLLPLVLHNHLHPSPAQNMQQ